MNNYITLRRNELPVNSKIFYNNQLENEDEEIDDFADEDGANEPEVRNSILEDQFDKMRKRNHYLRLTTLNVDSINRISSETVNSQQVFYNKIGFLISRLSPIKLFIYQPKNTFTNQSNIYWEGIDNVITSINGIPTTVIEYDPVRKKPIFNIYTLKNSEMLSYFSWSFIKPLVQGEYETQAAFVADESANNFYYFLYTEQFNLTASDWLYINSSREIKLYRVLDTVQGYPTTSYYKVIPSRVLTNIYKIKLLDIKIPDVIFNVNTKVYNFDRLGYRLNGTLRLLIKNNSFIVNNIDYIGSRIKYDFFYSSALYDVNAYNNLEYSFLTPASVQKKVYPNIFIGTNIYDLLNNILPIIKNNDKWIDYLNNNIFELAYYFMIQYNLYYQSINLETFALNPITKKPDNVFYIYTVDLIKEYLAKRNTQILLKPNEALNNKMPEIYLNDYVLYLNNETFKLVIKTVNWLDIIFRRKTSSSELQSDFVDCYINIDGTEVVIGRAVDYNAPYNTTPVKTSINLASPNRNIYYTIGIFPHIPNYAPLNYQNGDIYSISNWSSSIFRLNNIQSYKMVDTLQNLYYYNLSYSATSKDIFIDYLYRFEYLLFRAITADIVNSTTTNIISNPQSYIFAIIPTIAGFNPLDYVSKVLYSRPNPTIDTYNQNTVINFVNLVDGAYYYIAYTYGQLPFALDDTIYILLGAVYTPIGTISAYYDVFTYMSVSAGITSYVAGMDIYNENLSKTNKLIFFQSELDPTTFTTYSVYVAVYNSKNLANYTSQMFYAGETLYDATGTSLNTTVVNNFEYVGQVQDVQFKLALDASIYLSEEVNYDVTATKGVEIVPPPIIVIPLDNIRIIETKTQTKYNVIEYTGKTLILDNKLGTVYTTLILSQPFLDRELNLFIFELSIKDPAAILPNIYIERNFEATVEGITIGTGYSIDYTPIKYAIIVEKNDNFQMQYLQNWSRFIYTKFNERISPYNYSVFFNRNYICANPEKTNLTGLQTYDLYPVYEVKLDNGYYDDFTFVAELEKKLNAIQYLEYNYYRKEVEYIDATNQQVNNANYERTRFKTVFNQTTREIDIRCYKVLNRIFYTAYYNPISPYLYFKIENANIENNVRLYIEVLRDAANNNFTNTIKTQLNKEFTTRVLPIFNYELRVISPVPTQDFIDIIPPNIRKDLDSARALLSKISLQPFEYRTDYPNLTKNRRNAGQMLKNVYNNSWSYVSAGKTIFNPGVPIPFIEDELVIIINNIYYGYEQYKLGRVVNIIDKTSNERGNYSVYIQMVGDTKVSHPYWIGDVIYGLDSGAIAMVVPYEWGMLTEYPEIAQLHSGLPSEDIIKLGYKNYLKYLFKYSGRQYLMDYIQKYNLMAYNEYNLKKQQNNNSFRFNDTNYNPFLNWPIQEVKNCFRGFEVFFDYPVAFKIVQNDLVLNFLKENPYCLFLGKNREGIYDTPKNILNFEEDQILDIMNYENNAKEIPWNSSFNNSTKTQKVSIIRLYLSYGSDNIIQNKFFIKTNQLDGFSIGDKVRLQDVYIRPIIQRNAFNIYNTTNHNLKMIITFEMYLSFILFRLVLVKLGVPVPMGPNDYLRLTSKNIDQMTQIVNSMYYAPSTTNVLAYTNFIIENYGAILTANNVNNAQPDLTTNLYMSGATPLVNRISLEVANIINAIILNRILKWFVQPENLLLWTKGDRQTYILINENYIDLSSKTIYRFELEVLDSFIFQSNLLVKDSTGTIIGRITYNNLYKNYYPDNNTFYTVYVSLIPGYVMSLAAGAYIYAEDMLVKNRLKTDPVLISSNNNYVYLYDTYLKYRSVFQATSNNINTYQEALNFSNIDNIINVFYNLFNLNNQNVDSFKNGYYVSIARNEIFFNQADNIKGTYRVMINLLDNKNVIRICQELGLVDNIQIINDQIVLQNNNSLKNIQLIRSLMDICQLIVDLSPINTFLVDFVWDEKIEQEIFTDYRYQVRRIDNVFPIVGSRNVFFERYRYKDLYIYGDPRTNPNALVVPYLNAQFQKIYSDEYMKIAKAKNTIETSMCVWSNILAKDININEKLTIFDELQNTQLCYGILWVDIEAGEDTAYVVFMNGTSSNKTSYTINRNNLNNYVVNFNFIYVDQQKSIDVRTVETNEMNQTNIIKSMTAVIQSQDLFPNEVIPSYSYNSAEAPGSRVSFSFIPQYRIFKLKLNFPVKYDIIRGTPVLIKDYYTTIYKAPNTKIKGGYKLYIEKNWTAQTQSVGNIVEYQFNLQPGSVININYGSYNPIYLKYINSSDNIANQLFSFENNDIIHEETNVVKEVSGSTLLVDGKTMVEVILENPLKYEFKSGLPIIFNYCPLNMMPAVFFSADYIPWQNTLYNNNNIICNTLSTQNIIVNGEWYTKIFYQSEHNLDIYGVTPNGIKGISPISTRKVYISGMKGIVGAKIGFQQIERNYLNSSLVTLEEYQDNKYIKPAPDGLYQVENIQKEDGITILSSNNYDISIPGTFESIYNTNTPEQDDEFIDNNQNYRWFYVVEAQNLNISGLAGQTLYQYTPSNTTPFPPGATPSNTETRMDALIHIKYIETTTFVNTQQTFLTGKTIYKIYGRINTTNLSSMFLMLPGDSSGNIIYTSTAAFPEFPPPEIFLTDNNKQFRIGVIYYLYNDSSDFLYNDSLPKYNYYSITIKGRFRGFGGSISMETINNTINSIEYTISNIDIDSSVIELNIEDNQDIYCSFYRFNSYGEYQSIYDIYNQNYNKKNQLTTLINPLFTGFQQVPYQFDTDRVNNKNVIINYYDIYPSRYGFIADDGILYKSVINKPYSTDLLDYIYLCFKNIDSNVIVDQNNPIGDKIIFAKVYVKKQLNNYDIDYTNYEVIYDTRLLPNIKSLEVFFLDKDGYLVNFNNLDNNFLLEIQEYVERVKNINTRNGMVY